MDVLNPSNYKPIGQSKFLQLMMAHPVAQQKNYSPGVMKMLKFLFSPYSRSKGLSAGRQWAVENSNGVWVAITDIDVRLEQDWISNLVEMSAPIDEDETVVAVTGRTVFEHEGDIVSRLRSVEIATKYRSRPRRTSL